MWHVYILEANNGELYTGITNNLKRRMAAHKNGKGARFTRIFGFKKLRYHEDGWASRGEAMKREAAIKTWPREKKLKLINEKRQRKKSLTRTAAVAAGKTREKKFN